MPTKTPSRRYANRLVTFLPPREFHLFRELAYQRNQCSAQLMREIICAYLLGRNGHLRGAKA